MELYQEQSIVSCGIQIGQLELKKFHTLRPMCTKSPKVWATGLVVHGEVPFFGLDLRGPETVEIRGL